MTDQEISTLRDLNYIARRDYKPGAEVTARLLALSQSLLVGTYRTFVDVDAGYLLGMMAGTKDGSWGPHREMIGRLAAEMGVAVKPVPAPSPVVVAPDPVVGTDFAASVLAVLRANDIHVAPGKLAIGRSIDFENQACFQIGGRVAAEISGLSNTGRTDRQNPDEPHENSMVLCDNDGGWRVRQYQTWFNGMRRNTKNRKASTLAVDSMGDVCQSHVEVGVTSDGGQSWYIRTSGIVVDFCTYKAGGFIRILRSVLKYGSTDVQQL